MSYPIQFCGKEYNAYRCALHIHTTLSDGEFTPEEVIRVYENHGFDVLCVTDHHRSAPVSQWKSSMLLIPGMEFHPAGPRNLTWHFVAYGIPEDQESLSGLPAQNGVNRVRELGGLCHAAHPFWSGFTSSEIMEIQNLCGVEIYNSGSQEIGKSLSYQTCTEMWDKGVFLPPLGVDDLHHKPMACQAWTTVLAEKRDRASIFEAIRAHRLFASTGPEFTKFEFSEGVLSIEFTPCAKIIPVAPALNTYRLKNEYYFDLTRGSEKKSYSSACTDLSKLPENTYVQYYIEDEQKRGAWSVPFRIREGKLLY